MKAISSERGADDRTLLHTSIAQEHCRVDAIVAVNMETHYIVSKAESYFDMHLILYFMCQKLLRCPRGHVEIPAFHLKL